MSRECWRCGRPIDDDRGTPSCDSCRDAMEKRVTARARHDGNRLRRMVRQSRKELDAIRKRMDGQR